MNFKYTKNISIISFISLFIFIFLAIIKVKNPDTDVYFLAATGRFIWENKCIPEYNPFYILSDYKIIIQQWLCCLFNYFIFHNFGNPGIYIASILCAILFNIIIYSLLSKFLNQKFYLFLGMLFCNIIMSNFYNTRPSLISACIIFTQILNFILFQKEQKKKFLVYNILLSILLINWHQSMWPISLIFAATFILPKNKISYSKYIKQYKYYIYTILLMFISGIINPNLSSGMFYLLKSANVLDSPVSEMAAVTFVSNLGFFHLITFSLILYHIITAIKKKDMNLQIFGLEIISFVLGSCYLRNIWFALIGFIFAFTYIFKNFKDISLFKEISRVLNTCIFCLNIILIIFNIVMPYNSKIIEDNTFSPYSASQYLENYSRNIILYTDFNNGSFMEWNGYKVYIDARSEIAQKPINEKFDLFTEYLNVYAGTINYSKFIEKYHFTHLLVIKNNPFFYYLNSNHNYEPVLQNKDLDYELFEYKNS